MFLKRAALFALFPLIISGCATQQSVMQQHKINTLNSQLNTAQQQLKEAKQAQLQAQVLIQSQQEKLESEQMLLFSEQHALEQANQQINTLSNELALLKQEKQAKTEQTTITPLSSPHSFQDKTVLGQAEWVYINKAKKHFNARIDTGATTSSINALDIQRFERDGKKWLRFNISHGKDEQPQIIEAPIVRFVKVLQSNKPDAGSERPVIKLQVHIGDMTQQAEFTLTDRRHLKYPVLIGRAFMKDVVLVDIAQEYIHPKYNPVNKSQE